MEQELFDVALNSQGKEQLFRVRFWAKFFYICTLITLVFDIINAFISLRNYRRYERSVTSFLKYQYLLSIVFLIIYAILLPLQAWFFYRFSTGATKAFQYGNTEEFNSSFQWLLKHAMIAAILFALNSFFAISVTVVELVINSIRF